MGTRKVPATAGEFQKAKGPAEAATSPSHGSTHRGTKDMNEGTDTTAAAEVARVRSYRLTGDRQRADKFRKAGYYAFALSIEWPTIVFHAERLDGGFIGLAEGPDEEPDFLLSGRAFDTFCVGFCRRFNDDRRPLDLEL
ncbi:hypothetical protein [Aureimonas psammosilenae]|uniref:hypothetical protein n=1 Tax=Aureimonas psammosilenae TaxID=2495496 RepID=UPI001260F2D4|nr:hypothetical protein [Aureimonas psammosilenae]